MKNAYGTKKHIEYLNEYIDGFNFEYERTVHNDYFGFDCITDEFKAKKGHIIRVIQKLSIHKDNIKLYECEIIDGQNSENLFYPIVWMDNRYLLFRKSLYGFTLLNLENFDELNYFPEKVFHKKEDLILSGAVQFRDLLILDGCKWAYPYEYVVYDLFSKKYLFLTDKYDIYFDCEVYFENDNIIFDGMDKEFEKKKLIIKYSELVNAVRTEGTKFNL